MIKLYENREENVMNKISVKNMDGTMEEVDLINAFKISEIGRAHV